jgi:hypothetical protein
MARNEGAPKRTNPERRCSMDKARLFVQIGSPGICLLLGLAVLAACFTGLMKLPQIALLVVALAVVTATIFCFRAAARSLRHHSMINKDGEV